jgi:polyphosphate kinase 2 (PPK2 family)
MSDATTARVIVLLEGRDGSGKTTTARDIAAVLGASRCRIVSTPRPTAAEQRRFYFERWLAHLPGPGKVTLFDRSWYNRALVERVMGYSTPRELGEFFDTVPRVEADLSRRGFAIVKVFLTIGLAEQERRLAQRERRGELSPVDMEALARREAYARAEHEMFDRTSSEVPWVVLPECERAERCAMIVDQIAKATRWKPLTVAFGPHGARWAFA